MGIQFQFSDIIQNIKNYPTTEICQNHFNYFLETIKSKDHGFFRINNDTSLIEQSEAAYKKFKGKKYFIHVGIGGSSLGTETLVKSLGKPSLKNRILNLMQKCILVLQIFLLSSRNFFIYF